MLGVDNGSYATGFLCLRYGMDGKSCLAAGFGTVDFDDSSTGIATHSERVVQSDGAGWNHFHVVDHFIAEFHYGTTSECFLDLSHGLGQGVASCGLGVGGLGGSLLACFFFRAHMMCVVLFPMQR